MARLPISATTRTAYTTRTTYRYVCRKLQVRDVTHCPLTWRCVTRVDKTVRNASDVGSINKCKGRFTTYNLNQVLININTIKHVHSSRRKSLVYHYQLVIVVVTGTNNAYIICIKAQSARVTNTTRQLISPHHVSSHSCRRSNSPPCPPPNAPFFPTTAPSPRPVTTRIPTGTSAQRWVITTRYHGTRRARSQCIVRRRRVNDLKTFQPFPHGEIDKCSYYTSIW